jgi:hypothetical protein
MGSPLRDANTAYSAMNSDIRDSLVQRFDAQCDMHGLAGGHFQSFLLKRGYAAPLAASDVVFAVRARLSRGGDFGEAFGETFSVVRMVGKQTVLSEGVDSAKVRMKCVLSLGLELMNRKTASIVNSGAFRICYIHNPVDHGFPIEVAAIVDLGQFLIQAFREINEDVLPVVIGVLDQTTQMWLMVAVSTGFEFGDVEASMFGAMFKDAARNAGIEITMDSFDSFVCQIPNDLLLTFINELALLALGGAD